MFAFDQTILPRAINWKINLLWTNMPIRPWPFRLPRVRQLRFVLKGRAAAWMRQSRPNIPRLPQARLQACLDARDAVAGPV